MGAVLDQVVEVEIFGHFRRLGRFSGEKFPGMAEDLGYHAVVIDGKIKGSGRVQFTDIACSRHFVSEGDAYVDIVAILRKKDLLDFRLSQFFALSNKDASYLHPTIECSQIGLVIIDHDPT